MELSEYTALVDSVRKNPHKPIVAVAGAADRHTIEAVLAASDAGVAQPYLVGNTEKIKEILRSLGRDPVSFKMINAASGMNEAQTAVELIKNGEASFLMKGMIETSDLLRPVVKKENGLRTGRAMSHLGFHRFKGYHKLICCTDGAMIPHPTLEQKRDILINALDALRCLGYDEPKVACVCCKETLDAKIPETVDARALRDMARAGEFGKCFVEGPISYDIAMSAEIATLKGFDCAHSGDFDVILVPDINSGNILGKSWMLHSASVMAGVVMGAKIPIILTSRGATAEEKFLSLALASVLSSKE